MAKTGLNSSYFNSLEDFERVVLSPWYGEVSRTLRDSAPSALTHARTPSPRKRASSPGSLAVASGVAAGAGHGGEAFSGDDSERDRRASFGSVSSASSGGASSDAMSLEAERKAAEGRLSPKERFHAGRVDVELVIDALKSSIRRVMRTAQRSPLWGNLQRAGASEKHKAAFIACSYQAVCEATDTVFSTYHNMLGCHIKYPSPLHPTVEIAGVYCAAGIVNGGAFESCYNYRVIDFSDNSTKRDYRNVLGSGRGYKPERLTPTSDYERKVMRAYDAIRGEEVAAGVHEKGHAEYHYFGRMLATLAQTVPRHYNPKDFAAGEADDPVVAIESSTQIQFYVSTVPCLSCRQYFKLLRELLAEAGFAHMPIVIYTGVPYQTCEGDTTNRIYVVNASGEVVDSNYRWDEKVFAIRTTVARADVAAVDVVAKAVRPVFSESPERAEKHGRSPKSRLRPVVRGAGESFEAQLQGLREEYEREMALQALIDRRARAAAISGVVVEPSSPVLGAAAEPPAEPPAAPILRRENSGG